jgi:uncharacterized protein
MEALVRQITLGILIATVIGGMWIYFEKTHTKAGVQQGVGEKCVTHSPKERFVNIGTGGLTGIYYPVGGAICRLLNKGSMEHGLRCSVESTGGSVYNLNTLKKNEFDFAIAQTDLVYHAYHKTAESKAVQPNESLRTVLTLYTEPLTIVAGENVAIHNLEDLKKRRVNIGAPGSGQRATMMALIQAMGWTKKDFSQLSGLNPVEQSLALCDGKVDAIVYSVGHPNGSIQEAVATCNAKLVPVEHKGIDELLKAKPYYVKSLIPQGLYRGESRDVPTFGVKVALMTTEKQDPKVVEHVVSTLMNNFETFKRLHPVLSHLKASDLLDSEHIIAPFHEGVKRYMHKRGIKTQERKQ